MFIRKFLRFKVLFILCIFLGSFLYGEPIKTPAEQANYTQYTQYKEIARFLSQIDQISPYVSMKIVGRSKKTENYPARDIFLCVVTEEGIENPSHLNRNKPTFFIIASQHGNEQSAKEAALWLIRDLAEGKLNSLLQEVNFLILPQANPYGTKFDQRRNEQNLDLNRDHVKLEAPEVEAIHRVFRTWMPEVTMDVHEKGDSYYRISIGCVSNANISHPIQKFSRHTILAEVERNLESKNIPFHEYLITQRMGIDSSAGVDYSEKELQNREWMKRYSTTDLNDGRNSLGIYQTFSFIQEGSSRHDLKTLKKRTNWQYWGIRYFAESVGRHGKEILSMANKFRENVRKKAGVYSKQDLVHLRMKYARDKDHPTLTIKKFKKAEERILGVLKVDKKAGDPLTRKDVASYPHPSEYKVVKEVVENWFPLVERTVSVPRPLGYIVPDEHQDLIETMLRHDLKVGVFTKDASIKVESYQITHIVPSKHDYLPPEEIGVEKKEMENLVQEGDYYVSCAQPGANLIPCLLEPQSQYGFIRYWKFNLVPEIGDIFPFYRLDEEQELSVVPYKRWER
ncbi:DUF2817 domain-containing protein [bacterium]|nr:DUF2817 domain-containing protein [bacterium]